MDPSQISVNLYSLRERLKSPEAFAEGIKKLAAIGFQSVQLSGVDLNMMSEVEFVRVCGEHGIAITATHLPPQETLRDPQKCIDRLGKLGVTNDAYSYPAGVDFGDESAIDRWLTRLNEVAELYKKAGLVLSYHNHHIEFMRSKGKLIQERVFSETSINFEIDTYWIQAGGQSPLDWVKRCAEVGRLPLLHAKDFRIAYDPQKEPFERISTQFAEIGAGVIDFAPIIAAAEAGGCQSYIIEQDSCYGRDEFEAVGESFRYLRDNFAR